jgi:Saccharopine dehydrogenase NADP binding domain
VSRIVVLGGRGFFGRAAVDLLRREGLRPLVASRRAGGDLLADAERSASLRAALLSGDVVIDAAGPFQRRSTTLIEACLAIGCDLIDIADSLDYVRGIQELASRADACGVRVLTACSSVSAVSAALIRLTRCPNPVRVSAILAPATGNTSTAATAGSLMAGLERPVRTIQGGSLVERLAFSEVRPFEFPPPVGRVRARLAESPDAVMLPPVWPMLRTVDFWLDTRRDALNALIGVAARSRLVRTLVRAGQPLGRRLTKRFGPRAGGFGIAVEDAGGERIAAGFVHATHSYLVAVAPAVLAAKAIARGAFDGRGLIPADRYGDPRELAEYLKRFGIFGFGFDS